jgi:hypothetical protein
VPILKLFFDQCLSKRLAQNLLDVFGEDYPDLQTKHLSEIFANDTSDAVWLPQLAEEENWIVVTSDQGRESKKPQLPILCADLKITHLVISGKILSAGLMGHKHAFYCMWPLIVKIPLLPKGARIDMKFKTVGLDKWPVLTIEGKSFSKWFNENFPSS